MSFSNVSFALLNKNIIIWLIIAELALSSNGQNDQYLPNPINYVFHEKFVKVRSQKEAKGLNNANYVLDFIGLVNQHGYAAEEHKVVTEDGYILTIHRIPPKPDLSNANRPLVFLQHGLFVSSDSWVLMGPEQDLAFLLSNAGYDVWIGNVRGNTYSRAHKTLTPDNKEFWNYSWHEIGVKDLPAMIDYVLDITESECLIYIGHSMGTTVGYVLLSEKPEYNKKFKVFVSLAPIAFWKSHTSIEIYNRVLTIYQHMMSFSEDSEAMPQSPKNSELARLVCQNWAAPLCKQLSSLASGSTLISWTPSTLAYILSYYPAGISIKTVNHYRQSAKSGIFQQYDYSEPGNQIKYNQRIPPIYNLSRISAPVILIYGRKDVFATELNVFTLRDQLPHVALCEAVKNDEFSHLDFLWAPNARELLYDRILLLIDTWKNSQCVNHDINNLPRYYFN